MKAHRKKQILIILLISIPLLAGMIWQNIMVTIEQDKCKTEGEFVDTGSYKAHCYAKGDGDTVTVFVAGSGTPCAYTDFYYLQERLAEYGQTICFDHAGSGQSSDADRERTIENMVSELETIIDHFSPDKKVIFVCHCPDKNVIDAFKTSKTRSQLWDNLPNQLAYKEH